MNVIKVSLALLTLCVIKGRVGKARICCFCHCYNYCRTICKKALLSSNFTASACRILSRILSPLYQMILTLDTEAAVYTLPDRGLRRRGVHANTQRSVLKPNIAGQKGSPILDKPLYPPVRKKESTLQKVTTFFEIYITLVEGSFNFLVGEFQGHNYRTVDLQLGTTGGDRHC